MGLFSSNNAEKAGAIDHQHVEQHREHSPNSDLKAVSSDDNELQTEFSPAEQKRILRRIDKRLVITIGFMYCVSLMDRTNLSNAAIAGMRTELEMVPTAANPNPNPMAYSIVTLVFFTTYVFFQPPATVLTKKIGPRNFLAAICFLWGVTMIGMGFVTSWQQLAALRVVLGVFEVYLHRHDAQNGRYANTVKLRLVSSQVVSISSVPGTADTKWDDVTPSST
jgi:hypothetical protein